MHRSSYALDRAGDVGTGRAAVVCVADSRSILVRAPINWSTAISLRAPTALLSVSATKSDELRNIATGTTITHVPPAQRFQSNYVHQRSENNDERSRSSGGKLKEGTDPVLIRYRQSIRSGCRLSFPLARSSLRLSARHSAARVRRCSVSPKRLTIASQPWLVLCQQWACCLNSRSLSSAVSCRRTKRRPSGSTTV
jgi:hypothetical protein